MELATCQLGQQELHTNLCKNFNWNNEVLTVSPFLQDFLEFEVETKSVSHVSVRLEKH